MACDALMWAALRIYWATLPWKSREGISASQRLRLHHGVCSRKRKGVAVSQALPHVQSRVAGAENRSSTHFERVQRWCRPEGKPESPWLRDVLCLFLCAHKYTCVCAHAHRGIRGQLTGSPFSPPIMGVPDIKCRSSGLAAHAYAHRATPLVSCTSEPKSHVVQAGFKLSV